MIEHGPSQYHGSRITPKSLLQGLPRWVKDDKFSRKSHFEDHFDDHFHNEECILKSSDGYIILSKLV